MLPATGRHFKIDVEPFGCSVVERVRRRLRFIVGKCRGGLPMCWREDFAASQDRRMVVLILLTGTLSFGARREGAL